VGSAQPLDQRDGGPEQCGTGGHGTHDNVPVLPPLAILAPRFGVVFADFGKLPVDIDAPFLVELAGLDCQLDRLGALAVDARSPRAGRTRDLRSSLFSCGARTRQSNEIPYGRMKRPKHVVLLVGPP
jgi:hypothetical protein